MDEPRDIYKAAPPDAKPPGPGRQVDPDLQLARKQTWNRSLWFTMVMLLVLGGASWLLYEPEPEEDGADAPLPQMPSRRTALATNLATRPEPFALEEEAGRTPGGADPPAVPPQIGPQRAAEAMGCMRIADRHMKMRNWDEAEKYCRRALDLWPDMTPALRLLGVIYNQRGQFDQAIPVLEKALRASPFSAEVYNNLATSYMQKGNMDKAEELLQTALQIRPDYLLSVVNLGMLYTAIGLHETAADYLDRALAFLPRDPSLRNNLGVALLRMGRYEDARRQLRLLLELTPAAPAAYFNMAITYALERRDAEALEWIRKGQAYCSPVGLKKFLDDQDFDTLRANPEFQQIYRQGVYPKVPGVPAAPR